MSDLRNNLVPTNIQELFLPLSCVHSYGTRSSTSQNFYRKKIESWNKKKKYFSRLGVKLWNEIPTKLRTSGRKNVLRKLLRIPNRRLKAGFFCELTGFVCCWSWVKCTRFERLLPVKHFIWHVCFFFRRLKITLDSEQPMLKEKRIIPSVWGGIKGFEHFLRGEYFSDCASD